MAGNLVQNGEFEQWSAGSPVNMAVTTPAGVTVLQLTKEMGPQFHPATLVMPAPRDAFIREGNSSFRATLTAAAAVGDFEIGSEGIAIPAMTGASASEIEVDALERYVFSFDARADVVVAVRVYLALRNSANTPLLFLVRNTTPGVDSTEPARYNWQATSTIADEFTLDQRWHRYAIPFEVPPNDGAASPLALEHLVWGITNDTGTTAQVIDLDRVHVEQQLEFDAEA